MIIYHNWNFITYISSSSNAELPARMTLRSDPSWLQYSPCHPHVGMPLGMTVAPPAHRRPSQAFCRPESLYTLTISLFAACQRRISTNLNRELRANHSLQVLSQSRDNTMLNCGWCFHRKGTFVHTSQTWLEDQMEQVAYDTMNSFGYRTSSQQTCDIHIQNMIYTERFQFLAH